MADPPPSGFPVVALGGSAGALQSFFDFFDAMSREETRTKMAYVVILHLSPDQESHLVELLRSRIDLPVAAVDDPTMIACGTIYVLPPDRTLDVADGALIPRQRATGSAHRPVDDIVRGLAREFGDRTTAIICSGTGSNGSTALGGVREAGGCVIAQAPDSAEFDEMPRRAIETGFVDMVLEPAQMVPALVRNATRLRDGKVVREAMPGDDATGQSGKAGASRVAESETTQVDPFERILRALQRQSTIDFRQYKIGTLFRRIDRRVHFLGLADWDAYAAYVETSEEEADLLLKDVLITVTSFFRDGRAWESLTEKVLKPLVARRSAERPIRIWTAGCATGEEAYSVAISIFELLHQTGSEAQVEIFATDASLAALARARSGRFPASAVAHLPENLVDRWFDRSGDCVQIRSVIRDVMIFAPQNLVQDPPFSRADLVICRNLLIYLKPEIQRRLVRLFHFALAEDGALFLGSAESVGETGDLFEALDKDARIWRRIGPTRHDLLDFPLIRELERRHGGASRTGPPGLPAARQRRLSDWVAATLADRYAPPAVVTDSEAVIVYYHGDMSQYLRPQVGEVTQNLMALAREGLAPYICRALDGAARTGKPESVRTHTVLGSDEHLLLIEATPIAEAESRFVISFVEERPVRKTTPGDLPAEPLRGQELEEEVRLLRAELATTTWAAHQNLEETRAYSEEMTSINEELRAANEELETSKEELQSLNEELRTVNAQLRETVSELRERTADLDNLMRSTNVATLFLDADLAVRWFSPSLTELFRIRQEDVGRPVGHIVRSYEDPRLEDDCRRVLATLERCEGQVESAGHRTFLRRITPYRDANDRIAGVVVTFGEVTEIQDARRYAERIVETVPTPLLVLGTEFRVVSANPAFFRTFNAEPERTVNRLVYDLGDGQWNIPELRRLLNEVLPEDEAFQDFQVEHDFRTIGHRILLLSGRRLDHVQLILLAIEDITERRAFEAHQAILMGELGHRVKNALAVVQGLASQTARRSRSLEEFVDAFSGRLSAFSRAHNLLLSRDWRPGPLRETVQATLDAHSVEADRVSVDGPEVLLSSSQALALSLVLHELETNATKYGAFSNATGRAAVSWREQDNHVQLLWRESGGPASEPAEREGFGSTLIRQLVAYQLRGEADLTLAPDGALCRISFPLTPPDGP